MMAICCCGETQMTLLSQNKEWVKRVVVDSIPQLINVYICVRVWQQCVAAIYCCGGLIQSHSICFSGC